MGFYEFICVFDFPTAVKQALTDEQAGNVGVDVATQGEILRAELERINSDDASMFSPA